MCVGAVAHQSIQTINSAVFVRLPWRKVRLVCLVNRRSPCRDRLPRILLLSQLLRHRMRPCRDLLRRHRKAYQDLHRICRRAYRDLHRIRRRAYRDLRRIRRKAYQDLHRTRRKPYRDLRRTRRKPYRDLLLIRPRGCLDLLLIRPRHRRELRPIIRRLSQHRSTHSRSLVLMHPNRCQACLRIHLPSPWI